MGLLGENHTTHFIHTRAREVQSTGAAAPVPMWMVCCFSCRRRMRHGCGTSVLTDVTRDGAAPHPYGHTQGQPLAPLLYTYTAATEERPPRDHTTHGLARSIICGRARLYHRPRLLCLHPAPMRQHAGGTAHAHLTPTPSPPPPTPHPRPRARRASQLGGCPATPSAERVADSSALWRCAISASILASSSSIFAAPPPPPLPPGGAEADGGAPRGGKERRARHAATAAPCREGVRRAHLIRRGRRGRRRGRRRRARGRRRRRRGRGRRRRRVRVRVADPRRPRAPLRG